MVSNEIIQMDKTHIQTCENCGKEYDIGNNQFQMVTKKGKIIIVCETCYNE